MWNIDLWNYWWYGAPVIFVLGCVFAGILSRSSTPNENVATIVMTVFVAVLWPIVMPVIVMMAVVFVPGYLLYQLGRWISSKF